MPAKMTHRTTRGEPMKPPFSVRCTVTRFRRGPVFPRASIPSDRESDTAWKGQVGLVVCYKRLSEAIYKVGRDT